MQVLTDFTRWVGEQPATPLLLLAIIGLLLFIIGLLVGYGVQRGKTRAALRRLDRAEKEKEDLRKKVAEGDEEQKTLARQLVKVTTEKDDTLVQLREVSKQLDQITHQLGRLQASNEQLSATNQTYATTIEDLNDQVIGLKTRNEQLLHGDAVPEGNGSAPLQDLERRLRVLEGRMSASGNTGPEEIPAFLGESTHRVTIGDPAPAEAEPEGDDLTQIRSIGPFNARQLRSAGVYHYAQIAGWSEEDLEDYAARIGYVADIMREQDWVGQARQLAAASTV